MLHRQRRYFLPTLTLIPALLPTMGLAQQGALEEVVVTAQKREQRVIDIAASVSAVSGTALEDRGIAGPSGLQFVVPSMQVGNILGRTSVTIRGVGLNQGSPGVAIHVDGVYQPYPRMGELLQLDLERVEVLRGPQGTLYGRNANGGAVNYITRAPENEFEGYALASIANYDEVRTQGMVNIPVSDDVSARITADWRDRGEGYVENVVPGEHDVDKSESLSGRIRLRYTPTDTLLIDLSANYSNVDGPVQYFTLNSFPSESSVILNPVLADATYSFDPWETTANDEINTDQEYSNLTANLSWDVGSITFKSITGYTDYDEVSDADDDGISVSIFPSQRSYDAQTFSQEFNLSYSGENVDLVGGVYYSNDDYVHTLDYDLLSGTSVTLLPEAGLPPGSDLLFQVLDLDTEVMAIFGDVTYRLTEQLSLMGGLRYNEESQSQTQANSIQIGELGPRIPTCPQRTNDENFYSTTPRLGFSYAFNDHTNAYVTYSKGFKAGGFNPYSCDDPFNPEEIEAYEVGLKTELLASTLSLNLSAFYYDYTDLQISQVVGLTRLIENAAEAEVQGAEAEISWLPNEHWVIDANVSWLDATYKTFSNTDGLDPAAGEQVLDGNRLNQSPKFSSNLSLAYSTSATKLGQVMFRADYSYRSEQYFREFNGPLDSQDAYSIVNLNIIWDDPSERYRVRMFANNVMDEAYITQMDSSDNFGSRFITWGQPRVYGVEAKVFF